MEWETRLWVINLILSDFGDFKHLDARCHLWVQWTCITALGPRWKIETDQPGHITGLYRLYSSVSIHLHTHAHMDAPTNLGSETEFWLLFRSCWPCYQREPCCNQTQPCPSPRGPRDACLPSQPVQSALQSSTKRVNNESTRKTGIQPCDVKLRKCSFKQMTSAEVPNHAPIICFFF